MREFLAAPSAHWWTAALSSVAEIGEIRQVITSLAMCGELAIGFSDCIVVSIAPSSGPTQQLYQSHTIISDINCKEAIHQTNNMSIEQLNTDYGIAGLLLLRHRKRWFPIIHIDNGGKALISVPVKLYSFQPATETTGSVSRKKPTMPEGKPSRRYAIYWPGFGQIEALGRSVVGLCGIASGMCQNLQTAPPKSL